MKEEIKNLIIQRIKMSQIQTGSKISPKKHCCGLSPKDIIVCSKKKDDEIWIIISEQIFKEKANKFLPSYYPQEVEKFQKLPSEAQILLDKIHPIRIIH